MLCSNKMGTFIGIDLQNSTPTLYFKSLFAMMTFTSMSRILPTAKNYPSFLIA